MNNNNHKIQMTPDEYQNYMDELSTKVSQTLHGARLEDGISACAACIGFGFTQLPPDQHEKMRAHIERIINAIIERVPSRVQQ